MENNESAKSITLLFFYPQEINIYGIFFSVYSTIWAHEQTKIFIIPLP